MTPHKCRSIHPDEIGERDTLRRRRTDRRVFVDYTARECARRAKRKRARDVFLAVRHALTHQYPRAVLTTRPIQLTPKPRPSRTQRNATQRNVTQQNGLLRHREATAKMKPNNARTHFRAELLHYCPLALALWIRAPMPQIIFSQSPTQ